MHMYAYTCMYVHISQFYSETPTRCAISPSRRDMHIYICMYEWIYVNKCIYMCIYVYVYFS